MFGTDKLSQHLKALGYPKATSQKVFRRKLFAKEAVQSVTIAKHRRWLAICTNAVERRSLFVAKAHK